jgi:hypothetical protein
VLSKLKIANFPPLQAKPKIVTSNTQNMPIPDKTYFGEKPEGGGISYGEARQINDQQRQIEILKTRIDVLLIKQVNELSSKDEKGSLKVWSPFALTVLTLLAIETLGRIISDLKEIEDNNDYEQSKVIVTPIYNLIDKNLSHKPTKKFYLGFEKIHGKADKKAIKKYSDVFHKYQRNTFNHGYQAKGVYLSHELDKPWVIREEEGFLIINPYLFWEIFKVAYDNIFLQITTGKNQIWRQNALTYYLALLQ